MTGLKTGLINADGFRDNRDVRNGVHSLKSGNSIYTFTLFIACDFGPVALSLCLGIP